jgi:hypothetical protein
MKQTDPKDPAEYEQPPPPQLDLRCLYQQPLTVRQRHYGLMRRDREDADER